MVPRNSERIAPILEAIRWLWQQHPEWTLAQLITKAAATQRTRGDIREIDDDGMLMGILKLAEGKTTRNAGA